MWELVIASENMFFSVSLAVMLLIAILEGIATFFGAGASSGLDSIIHDLDLHIDHDIPIHDFDSSVSHFLGWLRIGQVPVLMLLVIALTSFGLIGLTVQAVMKKTVGLYMPGWLAAIPVSIATIFMVRLFGGILHAVMPKDETTAVSAESLVGRIAVITIGTARHGCPAEAKAQDVHGKTHYFMVEPDSDEETFSEGDEVLLISMKGHIYMAVLNTNPYLTDK
jgi:hypothetical protein